MAARLTFPCLEEDREPQFGLSCVDGPSGKLERGATSADTELMHAVARICGDAVVVDRATEKTGYLTRGGEETDRHGEEVAVK
jgi:hypothetical protein